MKCWKCKHLTIEAVDDFGEFFVMICTKHNILLEPNKEPKCDDFEPRKGD